MANLNNGGLTRVLNYIKTWVTGLLNSKANSSHTHTKSQITDFPTIPSNTSQLTNDSGYITSSGSCNYANSAGNSDTLDGYHHDSFPKTYSALFTVNGLGTPGWSTIGTGTGGSCIQVKTTDNTYPSICFHRSGYSHCVLAEYSGQLGTMHEGDGTFNHLITSANIGSQSVNYATNSGYTNWLRTSSHTDHLLHTEWDGSYFWTYVTAGDGGYRAVRVERSNSSGWADSAGGVAWGNVSDRPWAVSQFTNDSGFITSSSLMYINGDRAHNAYRIVYGSFNNLNNISTGRCWVSFPSAFSSVPAVVMALQNADGNYFYQISNTTTTGFIAEIWDGSGNRTGNGVAATYIAIGRS